MELTKYHDPGKNRELLAAIFQGEPSLAEVTAETDALFEGIRTGVAEQTPYAKRTLIERSWAKFGTTYEVADADQLCAKVEGDDWYPVWKPLLDVEYDKLLAITTEVRDVTHYGAVGDGVTDCTKAFIKAFGNGNVHVHVPPGIFLVDGLRVPSWTRLTGCGKGRTVIRLDDSAPRRRRLLTNRNHAKGNSHISVERIGLDWNVGRLPETMKTKGIGNASSCLTYANVQFGWVKEVVGIDPGLHCFDLTSPLYNYGGDGMRARKGCQYIWLDRVSGYGFGDDGVTTHHSDHLFISNSHFCDPSGRSHAKGAANSNGIEVDDGSRFVWLLNNSTARCFGGVEIKAHKESSAASGVFISGHLSVNDNRSFNFRHIGHHRAGEEISCSAYHIKAQRLIAVAPIRTALYERSTPRALVISGYTNVAVNRFLFAGDPAYDYDNDPAAAVQFRARHVAIANGLFTGFRTASFDLSVAGGKNAATSVHVDKIESVDSAPVPLKMTNL